MNEKKYLDYEGLKEYHKQITDKIKEDKSSSDSKLLISVDADTKTLKITTK